MIPDVGKYSIRKKLTWMNLLVSGATLLIASSAFVAYDMATLRLAMIRNLSIQAQIAGSNCASAIVFNDPDSARQTLSALSAAPNILSVAIYPQTGFGPEISQLMGMRSNTNNIFCCTQKTMAMA